MGLLYLKDSYLKQFDAKVVSVKDKFVILDNTAFYPKSGGVENDTGTITRIDDNEKFNVVFTGKFDRAVSHEVDKIGLQKGDEIKGVLDWERRYLLMRYHTAAHLISGVFSKEENCMITGNQLTTEKGRMDLNMEKMDLDLIKRLFVKANELIQKDLPIDIYTVPIEEAKKDATLFKLAMKFPHDIKEIRIVDIKGYDAQADGGCHVKSLKEIGEIEFVQLKNKGKANRRVYFKIR